MSVSSRELEDLKPMVKDAVMKYMGFDEPTVVSAALNCIGMGYDLKKTVDKLSLLLEQSQASTVAERVHGVLHEFKAAGKGAKKRRKDIENDELLKKRRYMEDDLSELSNLIPSVPVSALPPSKPVNTLPNLNPMTHNLTPDKIKEMMANAQKMIQERKAQLQTTAPAPKPALLPTPQMPQQEDAVSKAKRAAELQAQIQSRLSGLASGVLPPPLIPGLQGKGAPAPQQPVAGAQAKGIGLAQPMAGPSPLILNEQGQTIDAKTGETVQLTLYTPTLKANIRAKRREQFKGLIERPPEEISDSRYFDPRVSLKGIQRSKRGFKFHEKGKFEQQATRLRAKAQLERLQSEIAQAAKKTGIASAAKIATIAPKQEVKSGEVPNVEWWDAFLLPGCTSYPEDLRRPQVEGVSHLVEHPVQIAPPGDSSKELSVPVYLTKKERKKLRRQNRTQAQKEQQEKVRLGLAPPLEPKVRMANLMRVLGTEAVQDPTKVEAHVRAQMAKRQRAHEEANAARKLTDEQRRDKKISKLKEDVSEGVHVAVYRIKDLTDPAVKFKIEKNCQQLYMTGLTLLYKNCNVLVVEGGPKQQRKMKRLLLHRIKWDRTTVRGAKNSKKSTRAGSDDEDSDEDDFVNGCDLVWEGMVKTRALGPMKFKLCPTEASAREQMKKLSIEHYWDLAYSSTVLETAGDADD